MLISHLNDPPGKISVSVAPPIDEVPTIHAWVVQERDVRHIITSVSFIIKKRDKTEIVSSSIGGLSYLLFVRFFNID